MAKQLDYVVQCTFLPTEKKSEITTCNLFKTCNCQSHVARSKDDKNFTKLININHQIAIIYEYDVLREFGSFSWLHSPPKNSMYRFIQH